MDVLLKLRSTRKYITDLGLWLWKATPLIALVVAVIVVALICVSAAICLERQIRLSGMGLQLLGVILVAVGLRDTRKAFEDQPTTWQSIKQYWSKRPPFGPRNQIEAASGTAAGSSAASAHARVSPGANAPLNQRVAMLEQQYAEVFDEVGRLRKQKREMMKYQAR